jgi:nicotinamide-nucleotide amidase
LEKKIFAELITIGDELLYGQILDTNSKWMSEELGKIGVKILRKTSIGDQKSEILNMLSEAQSRSQIVLITGGLGPTKDDITKKTLAEYFNDQLVINSHAEEFIKGFFEKRNRPFTELNRQQAAVLSRCIYLHNATGTAPGMWIEDNGTVFVSMPGVPYEMQYLMGQEVIPRLLARFKFPKLQHRVIRTMGLGESFLAEKIGSWEDALPAHIGLAYLPSAGEVKLRLSGWSENEEKLKNEINDQVHLLKKLIPEFIYSTENIEIEEALGKILKDNGLSISTAESCTGGYLSHLISSIPGSSAYFKGSVVSYSNESKMHLLKVKPETLVNFGAVSEETVLEMAKGAREELHADYAISTSGIAGPDGGTPEKPVGTVCIGLAGPSRSISKKLLLTSNRLINIQYSAKAALNMLRLMILEDKNG